MLYNAAQKSLAWTRDLAYFWQRIKRPFPIKFRPNGNMPKIYQFYDKKKMFNEHFVSIFLFHEFLSGTVLKTHKPCRCRSGIVQMRNIMCALCVSMSLLSLWKYASKMYCNLLNILPSSRSAYYVKQELDNDTWSLCLAAIEIFTVMI